MVTFGSEGGDRDENSDGNPDGKIYGDPMWNGSGTSITTNPTVPKLNSATVKRTGNSTNSSYYSFNVGLMFDNALYYKSGSNAVAVTNLGTGYSAVGSDSNLKVSAPVAAGSKTCTVQITSMKVGTITLLPNSTICDVTGQASTNQKITITLTEEGSMAKVPYVTVEFNGVSKKMQLPQ